MRQTGVSETSTVKEVRKALANTNGARDFWVKKGKGRGRGR